MSDKILRLAMLGLVDGNGHPYSWSAICNGYDRKVMADCPFPTIPEYLDKQPMETLRIPGIQVTHLWVDDPSAADQIAQAACIPHIVAHPEEVIGHVDGVLIATDIGHEHVERCRPFVEAGLPIFVDKPMVDNAADLQIFRQWVANGAKILSSSCMRYAKEFLPYRLSTHDLGPLRYASVMMCKSWERYGIHALEGLYPILGPGFVSARNTGTSERNIVHYKHISGVDATIVTTNDMYGGFGALQLVGTSGHAHVTFSDTFYSFKAQLESFVHYLRTGIRPFPFPETVELMQMLIAGIISRQEGGREVFLTEIEEKER